MKKKGWNVFRILLGCYLVFLGVCLLIQVTRENPTDRNLMTVFSVVFIVAGAVYALYAVKAAVGFTFRPGKGMHFRSENEETDPEKEAGVNVEDRPAKKSGNVHLITVSSEGKDTGRPKSKKKEEAASEEEKTEVSSDSKKPEKTDESSDPEKPEKTDDPSDSGKPDKTDAPSVPGKPDKTGKPGKEYDNTTDTDDENEMDIMKKAEEIEKDYEEI